MRSVDLAIESWARFCRAILTSIFLLLLSCSSGKPGTSLIQAARSGDTASIEVQLDQDADVEEAGGRNDWSPLLHAIHKNQKESVVSLVAAGADVNRRSGDWTPLVMAAGYEYGDIVLVLLEAGADPRLETASGASPLVAAVSDAFDIDRFTLGQCQVEMVEALLDRDPNLSLEENFSGRLDRMPGRVFKNPEEDRSILRKVHRLVAQSRFHACK